jgi:tRNA-specific 2-thiouridylase
VLGAHDGTFAFTVGQRRGLGVSLGAPAYVVETDAAANRVVIGSAELLARRALDADRVSWVAGGPPSEGPFEASVRVRSHGEDVPAVITPRTDDTIEIAFRSPQRALAPGQSAVIYRADEVLGGGRIVATR